MRLEAEMKFNPQPQWRHLAQRSYWSSSVWGTNQVKSSSMIMMIIISMGNKSGKTTNYEIFKCCFQYRTQNMFFVQISCSFLLHQDLIKMHKSSIFFWYYWRTPFQFWDARHCKTIFLVFFFFQKVQKPENVTGSCRNFSIEFISDKFHSVSNRKRETKIIIRFVGDKYDSGLSRWQKVEHI